MENRYRCYECERKFTDLNLVFSHLKNVHFVKKKLMQIKCVNNFSSYKCSNVFLTFNGLRKHLDKCYSIGKEFDSRVI